MLSMYPACFFHEQNGYSVVFPDINNLTTQGRTISDAMEMAVDCLASYLYNCTLVGESAPMPSNISNISLESVAKKLNSTVGEGSFVNVVAVDVAAYTKENFEKAVKKTVTIPVWLEKAASEKKINFSKVLQQALKEELKRV